MTTPPTITDLRCRILSAQLPRPWGVEAPQNHIIVTELDLSDGSHGTGFTWTPSIGARAVHALLKHDIRDYVIGRVARPAPLWASVAQHLREAGTGGITSIAMAGLDLAVWDAQARRHQQNITAELGQVHTELPVYGSGVNHHFSDAELAAQAERWVASGFSGAKIKVGFGSLQDDVRRVGLVREILGPDRALMIDANQRWTLADTLRALWRLEQFDLAWIEEPLPGDDLRGYTELATRTHVPIAAGENIHTVRRFSEFLSAGALDVIQPNIIRVGGITPFLEIAALAQQHSLQLAPHLLMDLSAQLAFSLPTPSWIEDVEDADFTSLGVLTQRSPVLRSGDRVSPRADTQGLGFMFTEPNALR
ncbi:MAG: mandelate racemase/muconate lactonizing enzyme family protein [Leucobacter sp.]